MLGFELVCDGDAVGTLRAALVAFAPGVVHVPSTTASAGAAADLFFTPAVPNCVRGYGTSLLLVKPHAVVAGAGGAILDAVLRSFDVTAAALLSLDRAGAEAVLELYRGVVANFEAHVESLTAGPTLALEVALRGGGDVVERLRDLAGPPDPELARILRPATLRALHGADSVRNAVLVTDLAEDAEADVRRLFCAQ